MLHFGYGSNLSIDFVKKELIPNARFLMKGYLPNFEVQFPFWSPERQAGYSGIMEAPGELVHGSLEGDLNASCERRSGTSRKPWLGWRATAQPRTEISTWLSIVTHHVAAPQPLDRSIPARSTVAAAPVRSGVRSATDRRSPQAGNRS